MSTHCSNKIKNLLKSDKVNELDCNHSFWNIKRIMSDYSEYEKSRRKAEKSKFDGINLTLMEIMIKVDV